MDSSMASAGASADEGSQNHNNGRKTSYKRLSSSQTSRLERFIKDCPHPDEAQRRQLAAEIGLEPRQIKFWFQNKRTQIKNQHERADNTALRVENDRIHTENVTMQEALKSMLCPSCGGPPCLEGDREHAIHNMRLENMHLKEEHEKVSRLLSRYLESQMLPPDQFQQGFFPIIGSSSNAAALGNPLNQVIGGSSSHDPNLALHMMDGGHNFLASEGIEKNLMAKVAATAMDELVRLVRINEPFWIKSSSPDGKLCLLLENYQKMFPKTKHFKGPNVRIEATKESGIVSINSLQLVDMFLDSDKWVNLFPTMVSKAETVKVIERGLPGNRSGALQLMVQQMHVLSPFVQPREFQFLRFCQQIEEGLVIADVSFDSFQQKPSIFQSWKHPSGCLIQEMPNGCCMVTWVEHVEVDDKIQIHPLYKDIIVKGVAYGAERWIMELQRMCERFAAFYLEKIPDHDAAGVINSLEGRRSIMNFSHRMLKIFCESITMADGLDFPLCDLVNTSGVRVSIRESKINGQPSGMIVAAATSIWLPIHYMKVFEFFLDDKNRAQWDVLTCGNQAHKVANISNGIHPGNCVSVIRPFIPSENNALILQESFTTPMGSYVIYAPTDVATMTAAIMGENSSMLPVLPSGFVICPDGEPNSAMGAFDGADTERSGGSLLTVAFQILASADGRNMPNRKAGAAVNSLLTSTILRVRDAFNCNN
ncbi:homeobox-leucine zipper protein HDG11-like [Vigna radiata var. radiata]|uniref:Homeobox-leucine zipper protein HDG11-like n=1 Tax=Vigna radiata var. radiata TaxID=3916 RepID=A0A1S3VGX7_VIGRR|nr:homeobox-leucine zipper protein HDG11-like [Vigna radiata var. radiata]